MVAILKYLLLPAALISTAYAAAITLITADPRISDIQSLDAVFDAFREHILAYNDGQLNHGFLFTDLAAIITNRKAYRDANLTGTFNVADSSRIVDYFSSSVGETIPATNGPLIAKEPIIRGMGEAGSVALVQTVFQNFMDGLADAIGAKITDDQAELEPVNEIIQETIQSGIDADS